MSGPNLDVAALARIIVAAGGGELDVSAVNRSVVATRSAAVDVSSLARSSVLTRPGQVDVSRLFRSVLTVFPNGVFTPLAGEITITGYDPTLFTSVFVPPTGHVAITGYDPTLVVETNTFVIPTGQIIIGGFPPFTNIFEWFDWRATVISQYANSPTILQLVELFNEWIAPGANLNAFYNLIWNIDTAQGYGLDVWGRILGVGRVLTLPGSELFFGFEESTTEVGFDQAPFFDGTSPFTSNFSLSDAAYRQLLLAKALANICDGSIPAINQILINLFGVSGNAYCTDGENMTMQYVFEFPLNPVQNAIVTNSGVLPKPAGVSLTIVQP